ncbi:hypothetical protein DRP05_08690 [Archaeoglobales archaeon]|nr:MAG: hypothetical protein DRP05_08690 [Archaeoglobales archaeon]
MPTQEEVLQAINEMGCATYKQLKEYFGLDYQGNSNLPQRIKALQKRKLIAAAKFGGKTIFVPKQIECSKEEAIQILHELGFKKRRPGRPSGSIIYRDESIFKLLNFLRDKKIVSWKQIREAMGWNSKTTNKYLNKLVKDQVIFEIRLGSLRLFTTYLL